MLSEPDAAAWRCWNGLDKSEYAALKESRRPLEGCKCRGCLYLLVRKFRPIARSELSAHRENKGAGNEASALNAPEAA